MDGFRGAFEQLVKSGHVYPSPHSRKEITEVDSTPSPFNGEALFPTAFRPEVNPVHENRAAEAINWRFRVPDGRPIGFKDLRCGETTCLAGRDFGDFLVWRRDGLPSYELAVVADDHAMQISEVVRGEDLLISTARQLLLYEALGWNPPEWYHCPLVIDPVTGHRMSKTNHSLGLRTLRQRGMPARLPLETYFSLEPEN